MTLIVSIGAAILPAGMLGAGAATAAGTAAAVGSGIGAGAAGAALGSTVAATTIGGALAAGTVGAGVLAGAGMGINSMVEDAQQANQAAAQNKAAQQQYMANQNTIPSAVTAAMGSSGGVLSPVGDIGQQSAATGGMLTLKQGGHVPLKDGAYIIPADVVSALGNGSSKAGAEFLRHLMAEVRREAIKRQGLGAVRHKKSA